MGLKKALKNFLIGKKGSYTGKTTSDLLVESLNSAGGGGGSSDIFIVNWIYDPEAEKSLPDKTFEEIAQAWDSGKRIKFNIDDHYLIDAFPGTLGTDDDGKTHMDDKISAIWFVPFTSSDSNTYLYCYTIDIRDQTTQVAKSVQFGS